MATTPTSRVSRLATSQQMPSGDHKKAGPSLSTQSVGRSLMATTTSRVSRLAALAQPIRPCEDDKAAVLKDFEKAAAKLHAVAVTAPDDKDELVEKEIWCRQWNRVMTRIGVVMERGRALGVVHVLDAAALKEAAAAEQLHAQWSEEIMRRDEDAAQTGEEDRGCSPMQEDTPIHAPSTSTRARPQRSMEVVITSGRKRSRQDLEEEDKETTVALPEGMVVHDSPCAKCAAKGSPCRGIPGRACEKCHVHKVACEKWSGRSWAADKTGKAPARPVRVPKAGPSRRQPSPVSMDDDSAIEEPKEKGKTKTPVASSKTEISKAQLDLYMQNIVKCEAKVRTSQGG
ncbi:hypothetical protein BU15DRAFT_75508 [Melanogaster broomeanus]|nr:hypothetical protein BU15DRAFT_75508 [Melanogaster broomeanus]